MVTCIHHPLLHVAFSLVICLVGAHPPPQRTFQEGSAREQGRPAFEAAGRGTGLQKPASLPCTRDSPPLMATGRPSSSPSHSPCSPLCLADLQAQQRGFTVPCALLNAVMELEVEHG